jgi:hypothetical protein
MSTDVFALYVKADTDMLYMKIMDEEQSTNISSSKNIKLFLICRLLSVLYSNKLYHIPET